MANPSPSPRAQPANERWIYCRAVWSFPDLSNTAKLVWTVMWSLAGGQADGEISVTATAIAGELGMFGDASPVRRAIRRLDGVGAVVLAEPAPAKGARRYRLPDPDQVRRMRLLRLAKDDGQAEIWPEEDAAEHNPTLKYNGPRQIGDAMVDVADQYVDRVKHKLEEVPADAEFIEHSKLVESLLENLADPEMQEAVAEEVVRVSEMDGGLGVRTLWNCVSITLRNTAPGGCASHVQRGAYLMGMIRKRCEKARPPIDFKYSRRTAD